MAPESLRNVPTKECAKEIGDNPTYCAFVADACFRDKDVARGSAERPMATGSTIPQLWRPLCQSIKGTLATSTETGSQEHERELQEHE